MKSIYDIPLNSWDGTPNFLEQYKGKVTLIINTTVGCGNANQLEPLQRIQETYAGDDFAIVAIPTNDYCGTGVTYGEWVNGITCGADSRNYGVKEYGVTFNYAEMVSSNPGKGTVNSEDKVYGEPHELYKELSRQTQKVNEINRGKERPTYISPYLNLAETGVEMFGNFEKYLVDRDGLVIRHFTCSILNCAPEKTQAEQQLAKGEPIGRNPELTDEIIEEEYRVVCEAIEEAIAGALSPLNDLELVH
jgi:glutathione peroxidase-family protein